MALSLVLVKKWGKHPLKPTLLFMMETFMTETFITGTDDENELRHQLLHYLLQLHQSRFGTLTGFTTACRYLLKVRTSRIAVAFSKRDFTQLFTRLLGG